MPINFRALNAGGAVTRPRSLDARDFLVGSGADESLALQSLLTQATGIGVAFPRGFRVTANRNLYVVGATDLTGEDGGGITLDGDLNLADGDKFYINLGIPFKGSASNQWSGIWKGLRVVATANARVQRMIQVHSGHDYWFQDFVIDVTAGGDQPTSGIAGYNDNSWCTNPQRVRAHFDNVHVLGLQSNSGGEGIGHGSCSSIWVTNCYVNGMGDDALGLHSCNNVIVEGFQGRTTHGRLYLSNIQDADISGVYLERIVKPADGLFVGGGGLLEATIEDPSGFAPSNTKLSNLELVLPSGIPSFTYMARLRGIRNFDINGMQLKSGTSNTAGISLESLTTPGWADPEGLDPGTKARVRNTNIKGIHTTGTVDVGVQQIGSSADFVAPVTVDNSVMGPPLFFVSGTVWTPANRVRSGNPADLDSLHGDCVPDARLFFEGPVALADGFANIFLTRTGGITRWYPKQSGIIKVIQLELQADQTAGSVFVSVRKNGTGPTVAFTNDSTNPRGQKSSLYQFGAVGQFTASDYIEIITNSSGLLPTPLQAWIRVLGLYM